MRTMSNTRIEKDTENDISEFLGRARTKNKEAATNLYYIYDKKINLLPTEQKRSIENTVKNIAVANHFNSACSNSVVLQLLSHFEKLCNANDIKYPEKLREQISTRLIEELSTNAEVFFKINQPTEKTLKYLIPITVLQGNSFCSALDEEEFESLRYPRGIDHKDKGIGYELLYPFSIAAKGHPVRPREHLRKQMEIINELKNDPRYLSLQDAPNKFVRAAYYYSNNMHEYLEKAALKAAITPLIELTEIVDEIGEESEEGILLDIMEFTDNLDLGDFPCDFS